MASVAPASSASVSAAVSASVSASTVATPDLSSFSAALNKFVVWVSDNTIDCFKNYAEIKKDDGWMATILKVVGIVVTSPLTAVLGAAGWAVKSLKNCFSCGGTSSSSASVSASVTGTVIATVATSETVAVSVESGPARK